MIFDGSELKRLRDEHGFSRADVVAAFIEAGDRVSEQTVIRWESGRIQPRADHLALLARILECEVKDFFATEGAAA